MSFVVKMFGVIGGLMSVCISPAFAASGEMIANAGFEQGENGWSLSNGWSVAEDVGRGGSKALVWENADASHYSASHYSVAFEPGGVYRFEAWVKVVDGGSEKPVVSMEWYDAEGKWLSASYAHVVTDNDPDTDGWMRYRGVSRTLPVNVARGSVLCFLPRGCTGKVLFDDFSLVPIGMNTIEYLQCSAYHNTFTDEDGIIRFAASVHLNTVKHPLDTVQAMFSLKEDDGVVREHVISKFGADRAEFAVDAKSVALGAQEVKIRIVKRDGSGDIAEATRKVTKVEQPVRRRVGIDRLGRALLDGKPFFPLGMYADKPNIKSIAQYKKGPFNFVVQYGNVTTNSLNLWQSIGVYVAASPNCYSKRRIMTIEESRAFALRRYETIGRHPALFAWYIMDEASPDYVPNIAAANELLHEIDPDHPTFAVTDKPGDVRALLPCYDVIGMDPYPIGNHGGRAKLEICSKWVDEARAGMFDLRSMWHVPQAFDWSWYRPKEVGKTRDMRMPTRAELANMTWQGIAAGANGVCSYAFHAIQKRLKGEEFDHVWGAICDVAREVKSMEPVLLSDGEPTCVRDVPSSLIVRTYRLADKDWALIVNRTARPVVAKLHLTHAFVSMMTSLGGGVKLDSDAIDVSFDRLGYAFVSLIAK